MIDNVIPYIGGEEEKSEKEPLKLWGHIEDDEIKLADKPNFTAQCIRVPVSNGHLGAVFVNFEKKPSMDEMKEIWKNFKGRAQELELPSAPKQFLHYLKKITDLRSSQKECLRTVWLFQSADSEKILSISISLYAFHTIRSAVQQAAPYFLQSFFVQKDIWTNQFITIFTARRVLIL